MTQDALKLTGRQAQEYLDGWAQVAREAQYCASGKCGQPAISCKRVIELIIEDEYAHSHDMRSIGRRDAYRVALGEE